MSVNGRGVLMVESKDMTLENLIHDTETAGLDGLNPSQEEGGLFDPKKAMKDLCEFIHNAQDPAVYADSPEGSQGGNYLSQFLEKMVELFREANGNPCWPFPKGSGPPLGTQHLPLEYQPFWTIRRVHTCRRY